MDCGRHKGRTIKKTSFHTGIQMSVDHARGTQSKGQRTLVCQLWHSNTSSSRLLALAGCGSGVGGAPEHLAESYVNNPPPPPKSSRACGPMCDVFVCGDEDRRGAPALAVVHPSLRRLGAEMSEFPVDRFCHFDSVCFLPAEPPVQNHLSTRNERIWRAIGSLVPHPNGT